MRWKPKLKGEWCEERKSKGKDRRENRGTTWISEVENDWCVSPGRQKKGQIIGKRYRLVSNFCLFICQDKWYGERLVRAEGALWEVSALSYGSTKGICPGGPSCGNHCSVGRWAGAIRPPASHQVTAVLSVCMPVCVSQLDDNPNNPCSAIAQYSRCITHSALQQFPKIPTKWAYKSTVQLVVIALQSKCSYLVYLGLQGHSRTNVVVERGYTQIVGPKVWKQANKQKNWVMVAVLFLLFLTQKSPNIYHRCSITGTCSNGLSWDQMCTSWPTIKGITSDCGR